MLNIFKKKEQTSVVNIVVKEVAVLEKPVNKKLSQKEIVEEIHESFNTEVDRLLAEAKISKSLDSDKQELVDKCKRLRSLGFSQTKEVIEAELEIQRLRDLKIINENKEKLIKAINYFKQKYPLYKFITEESVIKICSKYGLVYGEISRYKGTVPDKNLKDIENFKIDDEDKCYYEKEFFRNRLYRESLYSHKEFQEVLKRKGIEFERQLQGRSIFDIDSSTYFHDKYPLEIATVVSDFDLKDMVIDKFKLKNIVKEDPIVLQPVWFENQKHYLIVTAWGIESSDPTVVNEILN